MVPSLLPEERPFTPLLSYIPLTPPTPSDKNTTPVPTFAATPQNQEPPLTRIYQFKFLPFGFFSRLIIRMYVLVTISQSRMLEDRVYFAHSSGYLSRSSVPGAARRYARYKGTWTTRAGRRTRTCAFLIENRKEVVLRGRALGLNFCVCLLICCHHRMQFLEPVSYWKTGIIVRKGTVGASLTEAVIEIRPHLDELVVQVSSLYIPVSELRAKLVPQVKLQSLAQPVFFLAPSTLLRE